MNENLKPFFSCHHTLPKSYVLRGDPTTALITHTYVALEWLSLQRQEALGGQSCGLFISVSAWLVAAAIHSA